MIGLKRKKFEELKFGDDYIFSKVMRNEDICKSVLEKILGLEIKKIEYIEVQKEFETLPGAKGIRLDVYVNDENNTIYNIEMQTENEDNIPKRSRYYQGVMDICNLDKGHSYDIMKKSFVIFICKFDLFQKQRYIYTFKNYCEEEKELELGDDTVKIFLNTKGTKGNVSPELIQLLKYIDSNIPEGKLACDIEKEVRRIKNNKAWRAEYMKYECDLAFQRRAGREEGKAEGRAEGMRAVIHIMKGSGESDEHIIEALIKQFHINREEAEIMLNQS